MKLSKDDVQSIALAALNTFSSIDDFGISRETALKELQEDIISEFDDLNSDTTKKMRLKNFNIKGVIAKDYSERIINLDDERKVIYGIRHMNGNKDVPYIQLKPNYKIISRKQALEIYENVESEFRAFNPLYLSFWSSSKVDADFMGNTYLVSISKQIKQLDPWREEDKFEFEDVTDHSFYEWYTKGYQDFHREFPGLKNKVSVSSTSEIEYCIKDNLIKLVLIKGERAGLIAAEKSELLGHDGIYFNEIYIEKKWKGMGLAKAIQRKFIQKYTRGHELIWGTIDSSNHPSYRTAISNGRSPIRFECFVNL